MSVVDGDPSAEQVLVVPRAVAVPRPWRGVLTDRATLAATLAAIAVHGRFAPRAAMEDDPSFKQVIPYLVLRDGDRWFLMRRTRAGGDVRLHDRWSIGIGGHLNPGDRDLPGGLRREWTEELAAGFVPPFRPVGLLNDDETPVGAVHLGVVCLADAAGRSVAIRETDKLSGQFATTDEVAAVRDRMETWSELAFDALAFDPIAAEVPGDLPRGDDPGVVGTGKDRVVPL
jgi:predicted NUDIX family phosphoesterase